MSIQIRQPTDWSRGKAEGTLFKPGEKNRFSSLLTFFRKLSILSFHVGFVINAEIHALGASELGFRLFSQLHPANNIIVVSFSVSHWKEKENKTRVHGGKPRKCTL